MHSTDGHGPKRAILYAQHNHERKSGDMARSLTPEPTLCALLIPYFLVAIIVHQD